MAIPVQQRRAECTAAVAGCRLDPEAFERSFSQQSTVCNAVQCNTARHAEIALSGLCMNMSRHSKHDVLSHALDTGGNIHFALGDWAFGVTRRSAEQRMKARTGHGETVAIVEVALIKPERAIIMQAHDVIANGLLKAWLAIRRKSHQLVLAAVDAKSTVVSERAVQQSGRMWKPHLLVQVDCVPLADAPTCSGPFAYAVHGEDGCLFKWAWVVRTRGVRLVMRGKEDRTAVSTAESSVNLARKVEFFLKPWRHGGKE